MERVEAYKSGLASNRWTSIVGVAFWSSKVGLCPKWAMPFHAVVSGASAG